MSLKNTATRVAVLTALHETIGKALKDAKTAAQAELKTAKAETGTQQVGVELPDGPQVAKLTLVTPEPAAKVTDEAAFTAWVRDHFPDEVIRRFVTEVRPAFVKALLKEMTSAGVPRVVDRETGEVHDVPGVAVQGRAAYQRLTFGETGQKDIAAAWRSGQLAGLVLPELTPGGDS